MAQAQAQGAGTGKGPSGEIGTGWRVFQVAALLSALSWLVSYILFVDGYTALTEGLGGGGILAQWGGIIYGLSPIISIIVIVMAVSPDSFGFLNDSNWKAWLARSVFFVIPFLWMINVFMGTPMVDKLFTIPLDQSGALPIFGGVFLHVVFQHWFQALAAMTIALVPEKFAALTESPTPAGIQCAFVNCE